LSSQAWTTSVGLMRDRNVGPYLLGNLISGTGTWFQTLAQGVLVYRLTHSAFLLGVLGFAQFASVFLLAPWTGGAADRFDRRRLFIATQVAAAVVTAVLTLLTALDVVTTAAVILLAAALGITNAFSTPVMLALVPSLVEPERVAPTIALNSVSFNLARALGPALAAFTIDRYGVTWAFAANSVSYLALVAGLLSVRPRTNQTRHARRPRLRESIDMVRRDRRLLGLLGVVAAVSLGSDPVLTLAPALVDRVFDQPASSAGYLGGAFGAGAVCAAFAMSHRLRGSRVGLAATMLVCAAGIVALALSPSLEVGMAALFVGGFGFLSSNTTATARLQLEVEDAQRGRVMALWSIAFLGARPIGSLLDGVVASLLGLRVATVAMALPSVALAAIFLGARRR
jgi:predicted MFS family arabinose efflux permease